MKTYGWLLILTACGSSAPAGRDGGDLDAALTGPDAARDATTDATAATADGARLLDGGNCPTPVTVPTVGDDCISYGAGSPCDSCGLPAYGYVCAGGHPDQAGCLQVSSSSALGTATYCCPTLACAHTRTLDGMCNGGRRMFQCPEDADGGLVAQPPAGCTRSAQPPPYQYFCCP